LIAIVVTPARSGGLWQGPHAPCGFLSLCRPHTPRKRRVAG